MKTFIRGLQDAQETDFEFLQILEKTKQIDDKRTCVQFTMNRWFPVANMTRFMPVKVYEYYAPGKFAYHNDTHLASPSRFLIARN